jgi:hypothetical protein
MHTRMREPALQTRLAAVSLSDLLLIEALDARHTCVSADALKQLQAAGPGELHVAGSSSPTNKPTQALHPHRQSMRKEASISTSTEHDH